MDSRYGSVDGSDLLTAVDQMRCFYKVITKQKKWLSNREPKRVSNCFNYGAEGETRTRMSIQTLDPEPSASTSSATSAR